MNIHEYQAKALFEKFGVPCPLGAAARAHDEIDAALDRIPGKNVVVKSQIHAGGRGKGTFIDGFKGGVKLAETKKQAREYAAAMLGNTLVTAQTGPAGRMVRTIYFSETCPIQKEYYLALVMDRASSVPVLIASTEGGVDIETVAHETPEKIFRLPINPLLGHRPFQARLLAKALQLGKAESKVLGDLLPALYRMFWECDASLVEINPLVTTGDGRLLALDAKVSLDDNALFRHPDLLEFRDLGEEDPKEVEASRHGLSYIALEGNIACLVNGAGLAMATMDIIKHFGGNPANFLDVGGGANADQVTAAFKIILSDKAVKGILVNIFGGIMKCDTIATGIIEAAKAVKLDRPLVVRLEGTNVEEGKKLLSQSSLEIVSADTMADAARQIVQLVS
ncbi:MAG: ADP-forming succinate--CoA ligase subunit beta [Puniceicoccaceae bacterium]|nr:MAG: ADP-forming succinate--CoA ligase subunit beta [Puniceicoccaceae bacterium]